MPAATALIWSPEGGRIEREEGAGFADLLRRLTRMVREEVVAVNAPRPRVEDLVDRVLASHPEELKMTPGKMVYEIQPKLEWDIGKAVLYLLEALELDSDDVPPLYVGDDITAEDAFRALIGRGIGILVADPADPELAGRQTAAEYFLRDPAEVENLLESLVR